MVNELRTLVGKKCPDAVLIELLTKAGWDSNGAVNSYFEQGLSEKYAEAAISKANVNSLFN
jgi:hypothetical protein